ncbi:MAG: hypothetical protein AB1609_23140 [Bacillota bacterium]
MTWLETIELLFVAALGAQVWRLHRRVQRLEEDAGGLHARRRPRAQPSHARAGLFATLVASYAELLARRSAAGPAMPQPAAPAARPPVPPAEPSTAPPAPAPAVAPGSNPDMARVAELLRQGLETAAIARQLGLAPGEVQVLTGLARAKGLLP